MAPISTTTLARNGTDHLPLPPVSRAHQEGLRALIGQLQSSGQDVTLLVQLAESLPRLRAGLTGADRQRIEELDTNESMLLATLEALQRSIDAFDALQGPPEQPIALTSLLVDVVLLQRLAVAAQALAEAANDLALRATTRTQLLAQE
jgi:hypothetical protein